MSISEQSVYFRAGAGMLIYNSSGELLMFMRSGMNKSDYGLQFPQGGLDPQEEPELGMWRELYEETTLQEHNFARVEQLPMWIGYDYPQDTRESLAQQGISNIGQVQRWFFGELKDNTPIDLSQAQDKEFDSYVWVKPKDVLDVVVPFKREMYAQLMRHLSKL